MRIPIAEAPVFALHAGNGRAHHGHSKSLFPQGRGSFHFHPEGWRHEESCDDYLCGRLDAAHLRHANHTRRGDVTATNGQHRTGRRRYKCAAWPFQYSRRHGHGWAIRQFARLPEGAYSDRHRPSDVSKAHYADFIEAHAMGFDELLLKHSEIHGLVLEIDVWRRGEKRERIFLPLPAQNRPRLFLVP